MTNAQAGTAQVKARKRKKRERLVSKLGEPILRSKAYIANDIVSDVAKRKDIILFKDRIGATHKQKNGNDNKVLDKVWVFSAQQKLEAVKERAFDCIEPGKHGLLSVLASNNHVTRSLFAFSIKNQIGKDPQKLKTEKLTVAFESVEEANRWLNDVTQRLAEIRRNQRPSMARGLSHIVLDAASSEEGTEYPDSQTPHTFGNGTTFNTETNGQSRAASESGAEQSVESIPLQKSVFRSEEPHVASQYSSENIPPPISARNTVASTDHDSDHDGGMATPAGQTVASLFDDDELDERLSLDDRAVSLENLHAELRADSHLGEAFYNWTVVRTNNNITVLRGNGEHNAKSIMVSFIIRAPPRLCLKTVLNRDHHNIQKAQTTMHSEVTHVVDLFNDVLETVWTPSGVGAFFLLTRKLITQRLWRKEDDGTFVIVFKACEDSCQTGSSFARWLAPCIQMDSVMTFSPLTSDYCNTSESSETLVTLTTDLGSFKGMWHMRNPLEWLWKIMYPFPFSHISSFIDSLIEQCVAIRTRAEAARFSVKPFLGSQDSDSMEHISNPLSPSTSRPATLPEVLPPVKQIPRDMIRPVSKPDECHVAFEDPEFEAPPSSFATASVSFLEPEVDGKSVKSPTARVSGEGKEIPQKEQSNGHSFSREDSHAHASTNDSSDDDLTPEDVATCDKKYWSCPGHNKLKVRGRNYLLDRKKVPADDPVFELVATDLMQVDQATPHIARFLPSLKHSKAPFTFIMQIMFGNPSLSLTFSWAAPDPNSQRHLSSNLTKQMSKEIDEASDWCADEDGLSDKPFELALARFLAGSTTDAEANKRRDGVVKLIPQISKGPWIIKQAVGTTPCLLGRKLNATYHRGPGYFEVDVDVNSSSVAANIVGLVQGATKKLWVDMAIVLEGHSVEELPEVLLGSVRCAHLDLNSAKLLNTATGEIRDKPGS